MSASFNIPYPLLGDWSASSVVKQSDWRLISDCLFLQWISVSLTLSVPNSVAPGSVDFLCVWSWWIVTICNLKFAMQKFLPLIFASSHYYWYVLILIQLMEKRGKAVSNGLCCANLPWRFEKTSSVFHRNLHLIYQEIFNKLVLV